MKYIEHIDHGGFGNVDKVQDSDGKFYARKTFAINQPAGFPPELAENVKKRFIREASIQANISHMNILPIIQQNLEDDPPSFIMPLASSSLYSDIAKNSIPHGNKLAAVMDILAGLEEIHTMDITHRDLKPQNVLRITENNENRYVISDFGLISVRDTQISALTQTGMRMGSDYYTAPEIVAELKNASPQSDIYSVGCIIHDLFGTEDRIPCNEIVENGPYADIMNCCTRKSPKNRFQSVSDLREALSLVDTSPPQSTEPVSAEYITLMKSSEEITEATWGKIIRWAEKSEASLNTRMFFHAIPLTRINEIIALSPDLSKRLAILYAKWAASSSFDFEFCDTLANRLEAFYKVPDISSRAEVILALLFMGSSHNRWYVERKFVSLCGPNLEDALAKRICIEMLVLKKKTCKAIEHLEFSISTNRNVLHPLIAKTLTEKC